MKKMFLQHPFGSFALLIVTLFFLAGIYAPFLASSKPLFVIYSGNYYFPLFRYLFYPGFYTKKIDIFFNVLMFSLPAFLLIFSFIRNRIGYPLRLFLFFGFIQILLFFIALFCCVKNPATDPALALKRHEQLKRDPELYSWSFELESMTDYEKLNLVLKYRQMKKQHEFLQSFLKGPLSTPWQMTQAYEETRLQEDQPLKEREFVIQKNLWLEKQQKNVSFDLMPLFRPYHWEEDVGGNLKMNQQLPWWQLSRMNHKDLAAALIFGLRISLVVGVLAVSLALFIGIPIGAFAGYYGGIFDIVICRLVEVWESMPVFFMLLLVVAMTGSKSVFIVIFVIGLFGWTDFSNYIRGEFFKQKNLPYIEACHAQGFNDSRIIFSHILPNAIPPILTLLPFATMAAITSEAGLSFLGLGEEGSCSLGVLMDEGRSVFPGESYLLWPPAILLTMLLISIALVGDALRDMLDPKTHV